MKATIWHNPKCGTSRKTLAILQDTPGVDLTIIEYLNQPYDGAKLAQIIRDSGLSVKDAIRLRGTDAEEKGVPDMDDNAILDAMVANPAYVTRPFVETEKGVRYCRPQELVREIL